MKSLTRTMFIAFMAIAVFAATSVAAAQQPFVARQTTYIVRFASAIDESDAPVLLRQPITLHLRKVRLERALQEIASRAGAPLSYSRAVVPLDRVVSIDIRDGSVLQAFYEVLSNVNVELWVSTPLGSCRRPRRGKPPYPPRARCACTTSGSSTRTG